MLWTRYGWRSYLAMSAGLGLLALSKVRALHLLAIAGAAATWITGVAMYLLMLVYRRRYLRACKEEGLRPSWRRPHP